MLEFKGHLLNEKIIADVTYNPAREPLPFSAYISGTDEEHIYILFSGGANLIILANKKEYEKFKKMLKV